VALVRVIAGVVAVVIVRAVHVDEAVGVGTHDEESMMVRSAGVNGGER
jgi:hypothetical protein